MGYHLDSELRDIRIASAGEQAMHLIGQTSSGIRRIPAGGSPTSSVTVLDAAAIATADNVLPVIVPAPGDGGWNELLSVTSQVEPGDNPIVASLQAEVLYGDDPAKAAPQPPSASFFTVPLTAASNHTVAKEQVASFERDRAEVEGRPIVLKGLMGATNDNNTNVTTITAVYITHRFALPAPPPVAKRGGRHSKNEEQVIQDEADATAREDAKKRK